MNPKLTVMIQDDDNGIFIQDGDSGILWIDGKPWVHRAIIELGQENFIQFGNPIIENLYCKVMGEFSICEYQLPRCAHIVTDNCGRV